MPESGGLRYTPVDVSEKELFREIYLRGATTTKTLRDHFGTDSRHLRKALGKLMYHDLVWPIGGGGGTVYWMVNTGQRGNPSPRRAQAAAKAGNPPMPKSGEVPGGGAKSRATEPVKLKSNERLVGGKLRVELRNPDEP